MVGRIDRDKRDTYHLGWGQSSDPIKDHISQPLSISAEIERNYLEHTLDTWITGLDVHVVSLVVIQGVVCIWPSSRAARMTVLPCPLKVIVLRAIVVATQTVFEGTFTRIGVVVHCIG